MNDSFVYNAILKGALQKKAVQTQARNAAQQGLSMYKKISLSEGYQNILRQ